MALTLKAGAIYGLVVFLIGFVFGALRVLLVVPHLGETVAVCLEAPVMLALSWQVSRWSAGRFGVPAAVEARLAMGLVAFAVLMVFEFALALAFGRTAAGYVASFATIPGAIGLAAQTAVAFFPLLQASGRLHS